MRGWRLRVHAIGIAGGWGPSSPSPSASISHRCTAAVKPSVASRVAARVDACPALRSDLRKSFHRLAQGGPAQHDPLAHSHVAGCVACQGSDVAGAAYPMVRYGLDAITGALFRLSLRCRSRDKFRGHRIRLARARASCAPRLPPSGQLRARLARAAQLADVNGRLARARHREAARAAWTTV